MLRAGDLIGDWVVEAQLGTGGMASVWRCHSRHAPRMKVAVKVLVDGEAAELRREAEVLAALNHPGVVTVFAPGEDPDRGCLFLAMELVEGRTLRRAIREGELTAPHLRSLTVAILEALQAMHTAGVCHRDLKPSNIMIRPDGRPVLVDFGIARDSVPRSPTGEILGTPSYIAPERLQPGSPDPARVDLYALGVSLFEALTGGPAFVTPPELTPQQRAWRIIEMKKTARALDPGEGTSADLRALVVALTDPDPAKRPASAAAARAMLRAAPESTVVISEPPVVPGPRRGVPVGPLLALGLVGAGLLVWGLWPDSEPAAEPVTPSVEEPLVEEPPTGPPWDGLRLPDGDELRRTDSVLLLGVPGGAVEPLSAEVEGVLTGAGWQVQRRESSGGVSVVIFARSGRRVGVLVSAEGPAAFVLLEDLDTIPAGESQIGAQ